MTQETPQDVAVVRLTGTGSTWWDQLNALSPQTLERVSRQIAAARPTGALSPKIREFIYVGVDALVTHLYAQGLAVHAETAIKLGATPEELIEVLQIAASVCVPRWGAAAMAVYDELDSAGIAPAPRQPDGEMRDFASKLESKTGLHEDWIDALLSRAPGHTRCLLDVVHSPGEPSVLGNKTRALVALALSAAAPIGDADAARSHARAALSFGAGADEIIEAIQLTSGIGGHAFSIGAPVVARVWAERAGG